MPGLFDRVARLARTPQGRRILNQATTKAQDLAKDPANRARVQRVRDEVTKRMNRGDRTPSPQPPPQPPQT